MYKKRYEWNDSMYVSAQRALAGVVLGTLGLEEDGFKLVRPRPVDATPEEAVSFARNGGRERFGSVQYSSHSYEPGGLPMLDISIHLYDDQFEEQIEDLIPVMEDCCRRGDFGDKFEPNISLLVKKGAVKQAV